MNNSIFREKSLSKVNSPEKLNDYIRISTPGIWMIVLAIILLLIGTLISSVFLNIEISTETGVSKKINPIIYVTN